MKKYFRDQIQLLTVRITSEPERISFADHTRRSLLLEAGISDRGRLMKRVKSDLRSVLLQFDSTSTVIQ